MAASSLYVGQHFANYQEFLNLLERRRLEHGERWVKDAGGHTVDVANKKIKDPGKHFKTEFVIRYANFKCVHGGINVPTARERKKGSRRRGCPCCLQISANRQENALVITKYHAEHNHELSDTPMPILGRRVPDDLAQEIFILKESGMPTRKIIAQIFNTHSTLLKRDDIYNILRKGNKNRSGAREETLSILTKIEEQDKDSQYSNNENVCKKIDMTEAEKHSKISEISEKMVNVLINSRMDVFDERCTYLQHLLDKWQEENNAAMLKEDQKDRDQFVGVISDHAYTTTISNAVGTQIASPVVEHSDGVSTYLKFIKTDPITAEPASSKKEADASEDSLASLQFETLIKKTGPGEKEVIIMQRQLGNSYVTIH